MKKRTAFYLVCTVCIISFLALCGSGMATQKDAIEKTKIGKHWKPTPDNPYNGLAIKEDGSPLRVLYLCDQTAGTWMVINTSFTKSLIERAGGEIVIFDAKQDASAEINALDDAVSAGYDVIILHPVSSFSTINGVNRAAKEGIPCFTQMIPVDSDTVVHHVSASQKEMGRQAGLYLAKYLKDKGEKGTAFEVWGQLGMELAEHRDKGFKDAAKESGEFEKIYDSPPTGWRDEVAMNATMDAITAHPEINVIYSHSDCMLGGVIQALKAANRYVPAGEKGHIEIASIDCVPWVLEEIKKGYIGGSVEDNPALYADQTAKAIYLYLLGQEVPKKTALPPQIITKDTTDKAMDWGGAYKEGQYDSWPIFKRSDLLPTPSPDMVKK